MPGILDLLYGVAEGRKHSKEKERERLEKAEAVAKKKAYGHLSRTSTYGKPQFGRTKDENVSLIRALLTYLSGDAPYADTNAMIFNDWAHHNKDLKSYRLAADGTLYYKSSLASARILEHDSTNNADLIDILALLAQANLDKYKAGRTADAAAFGDVSYSVKSEKGGKLHMGHRHDIEGVNPWDEIFEFFDPKHGKRRAAYIHIDTKGGTFDMGPRDYIMAKRAMGVTKGRSAQSFAKAVNKDADLYYDPKAGRLFYKNIDTDYLPFELKQTIGELIYREVFGAKTGWRSGDPYGWFNLGPGDDHGKGRPETSTPKPQPPEPSDEFKPTVPDDKKRQGFAANAGSATPKPDKKESKMGSAGPDDWEKAVVDAIDAGRNQKEKREILEELNKNVPDTVAVGSKGGFKRATYAKVYVTEHSQAVKEFLVNAARTARNNVMDANDKKEHELKESERKAEESRREAQISESKARESQRQANLVESQKKEAEKKLQQSLVDSRASAAAEATRKAQEAKLSQAESSKAESIAKSVAKALEDARLTAEATRQRDLANQAATQKATEQRLAESKARFDKSVEASNKRHELELTQTATRIRQLEASLAAEAQKSQANNAKVQAATNERIASAEKELTRLREVAENERQKATLEATKKRLADLSSSSESESKSKYFDSLRSSAIAHGHDDPGPIPFVGLTQSPPPPKPGQAVSSPSVSKTVAAAAKVASTASASPTKEKTEYELFNEELFGLGMAEQNDFIEWVIDNPLWSQIPRPIAPDNVGLWRQAFTQWKIFGKPKAKKTPEPKMPQGFLDLKKYYNDGLSFEEKLEFGKWLNATVPELYTKLFADNISEVNAKVLVEAVKQWKGTQPGILDKAGGAARAAGRGVAAVGGFAADVVAAPFVFAFEAGNWGVRKVAGLFSKPNKTSEASTPKPTAAAASTPYTMPADIAARFQAQRDELARDAAKRQAGKTAQAVVTAPAAKTTLSRTSTSGTPFRKATTGFFDPNRSPTIAPTSSTPQGTRQATSPGSTPKPVGSVPEYVREILTTAEAGQRPRTEGRQQGATGIGEVGQPIKGPTRQVPKLAGNYTKSQFEKGVTSRLVNTQNSLDAVKVISDNLLSIYPDSSFYIYSRKMSTNLFKHEGYRFANSGLEKFKPGTSQEDKGWIKVENDELLKLATENPELFRKIADWSTILSAANYAQDQNMPQVYEGLLTSNPRLLDLIKKANLDQEIKTRISFNVGASRLTIEPKVVTDFRKMLAGMSESDRRFLKNEGIHGRFPLVITDKGELLFAQDIDKLKKAVPLHKLEPQALKAAMGSVMRYLEANNIIYTLSDDKDSVFDRIDPTKFQDDPNAEPYENEEFMKNRPVLHIPKDKNYPELMPKPEPPLRSKEEDTAYQLERVQATSEMQAPEIQELLAKVNGVLKEKLFGSGEETRKWFEMKGIPDITLNGEGELVGSVHGHDAPQLSLRRAVQQDGNTGKTYVEEFAEWVKGLKNQDNRPDEIPNDLAHIEDLLADHDENIHHTSFGGNFLNHPNISQHQNDASLFPKFKPKYGRAMEIYNEKSQFNVNPNYWKHFIYTSQLTRNARREEEGEAAISDLKLKLGGIFPIDKDASQKLMEHISKTDLKRHIRLSHNGHGDLKPYLRDDAPPFAMSDIQDVTNDVGALRGGYSAAQKDEIIKSLNRMGLTLNDVGKFVNDHPELIKHETDAGLRKMGDGIYAHYSLNDRPNAPDLLKSSLDVIGTYYSNTVPEKLRAAGIKLNFDDPSNFAAGAINRLYDNYKKRTHASKESNVWQKNYAARRAAHMFDMANITKLPIYKFNNVTNTTDVTGERDFDWREALGTPIERFRLDTDLVKNGTLTNAGWTFVNKFMEPLLSERAGHSSELVFNGENVRAGMKKHARKDTNTRLISDSASAKLKQGIAAFEVFKRQLVGIAKDSGINISELRDENNTLSLDATDKAFKDNPEAMRRLNQLKEAFGIELSPSALDTLYGTANGELRRERQLMGSSSDFQKYLDMNPDDIEKLPWEEAILATYIRSMASQGIRPEATFFDFLIHHFKILQTQKIRDMIKANDVKGLIDAFSVWFRDQKSPTNEIWREMSKFYEAWLKSTGKEREYFGEKGKRVPGEPQKQAEPTKPRVEPTPPPTTPTKPGFETTKTTVKPPVTPSPTPMPQAPPHPATPAPINMNAPMGQSMVNAAQPWQMGQQNANLGGMPNPNIAGSMGFNATAGQQRPPTPNMGAQRPPTPTPTPGPNPFTADRQTFTPPQAGSANMGTASANARQEAEVINKAFEEANAKRSSKQGDDEVREETTSPDWVTDSAKEGAPSGTNDKLWKLLNWLKNKSLENLEDQQKLISQGSAGRAMIKGATDLAKGRPWYYDLVSEKKQEPKTKR